ncbi:MAG TPA: stalk domain-containing protein [Candidatus Rubrimentiphilum sp.]|nr:stalk domain-containing protein [Candidatus Rubrimentiphilum sp.]
MLFSLPALAAADGTLLPLHGVAARAGYAYQWQPDHAYVVLSRPGIVVVLRPGESVYQVNNQTAVADESPSYSRGDLYVTPALASRLAALAGRSPSMVRTASRATVVAQSDISAHGAISLEVQPFQGAEAIYAGGSAPPNAPVTITLLATVSTDVPTIVVSRQDVITDVNGRFGALIPIASAYERGTILKIVATSLPGVVPASAQLVINAPNPGVKVPLEQTTPHPAR